jgi:Cysteine-rich CPXCG
MDYPDLSDFFGIFNGIFWLMENIADFFCAFCGESNSIFVDISAGMQQSYVEDCQVCCRPNVLYICIDEDTLDVEIDSDCES